MRRTFLLIVLLLCAGLPVNASWPGFRGNQSDYRADAPWEVATGVALDLKWTKTIGSGYAQVVVDGGQVFVLFKDDDRDVLASLDASSGEEHWRYDTGPVWLGSEGSLDGTMSTPAVDPERVYGLTPYGVLFAVDRRSGSEVWRVDFGEAYGSRPPTYGFATSPLRHGETVIVQAGGKGGLVGFDRRTGTEKWKTGWKKVAGETPTFLSLGGRTLLIAMSRKSMNAIDPESGRVVWTHPTQGGGMVHLVPSSADRFGYSTGGQMLEYERASATDTTSVREVWKSKNIRGSYAIPVYRKGHYFGYRGNFLSCIDARTGERVWQSRPPGKGALILLGDVLLVWDITGRLNVISASPNGYRELGSLKVMDVGSITHPAYSEGTVYVRNRSVVAAISIRQSDGALASGKVQLQRRPGLKIVDPEEGVMATLVRDVRAGKNRSALIDQFMASQDRFPIVDGNGLVHFVYRGAAEDVGIHLGYNSRMGSAPMKRVEETDLWYLSYKLQPAGRYDYAFQIDLGKIVADTLNSRPAPGAKNWSELAMPGWQPHTREVLQKGRVEERTFPSAAFDDERKVEVYLPTGYGSSGTDYPLLIVTDGAAARNAGEMVEILDSLPRQGMAPTITAFLPFPKGRLWAETGGGKRNVATRMIAGDLIPFLRAEYRILPGRSHVSITGTGLGGYLSLNTAFSFPKSIGKVATQSAGIYNSAFARALLDKARKAAAHKPQIHMEWYESDEFDPGEDVHVQRDNALVARSLKNWGFKVTTKEHASGQGWGSWRNDMPNLLMHFLASDGE